MLLAGGSAADSNATLCAGDRCALSAHDTFDSDHHPGTSLEVPGMEPEDAFPIREPFGFAPRGSLGSCGRFNSWG